MQKSNNNDNNNNYECDMCGKENSRIVFSTDKNTGRKAKTCDDGCVLDFWVQHIKTESIQQLPPTATKWSQKAKYLAAKQMLQGESIVKEEQVTIVAAAATDTLTTTKCLEEDVSKFNSSVESLSALKEKLNELYKSLSTTTDKENPAFLNMRQWISQFDQFMRDFDSLYSDNFNSQLLNHIKQFHASDQNLDQDSPVFIQVKYLLRELVRNMPLNKLLYDHRPLLKKILGFDKYGEDKIVLCLDGGGVKGVVSLTVLKAIRDRLREITGIKNLKLTDCLDLMVGTSTGGIITGCMCAAEMDIEQVLDLYLRVGKEAFSEENKCDFKQSLGCRYTDDTMLEILFDIFGTKRLDDPNIAFRGEHYSGPNGIRFGFTTVTMNTSQPRTLFLRNYQKLLDCCPNPSKEDRIEGTDGCYLVEAVRCTASAPIIIHPYARFYAPLSNVYSRFTAMTSTQYKAHPKDKKKLYTHSEIILDRVMPERRQEYEKRQKEDHLMESGVVLIDGGLAVNNPGVLCLIEAKRLWSNEDNTGIRVISCGTGELPVVENPTWNKHILKPMEQKIFGQDNLREVIGDLIKYTFVATSTETEEATDIMTRFGSMLASFRRINPKLDQAIEMDDASPEAMRSLMTSAQKWVTSKEGIETVETTAQEIFISSSRLHQLLKTSAVVLVVPKK